MTHDILKRLGLDHVDITSPDFLNTLNRLQREARDEIVQREPSNDPHFDAFDDVGQFPGFDWMPLA